MFDLDMLVKYGTDVRREIYLDKKKWARKLNAMGSLNGIGGGNWRRGGRKEVQDRQTIGSYCPKMAVSIEKNACQVSAAQRKNRIYL